VLASAGVTLSLECVERRKIQDIYAYIGGNNTRRRWLDGRAVVTAAALTSEDQQQGGPDHAESTPNAAIPSTKPCPPDPSVIQVGLCSSLGRKSATFATPMESSNALNMGSSLAESPK
jgi:hypothetical protein